MAVRSRCCGLITDVQACGRGYEVVMLALHGFDAYGVEVSQTAVDACEAYAKEQLSRPEAYNFGPGSSSAREAGVRGTVTFVVGDFFKRDWEGEFQKDGDAGFDLIYDYTVSEVKCVEVREERVTDTDLLDIVPLRYPARNEIRLGTSCEETACTVGYIGVSGVPNVQGCRCCGTAIWAERGVLGFACGGR